MSIIATAVRHLMAAGVTGDALFAAIAEMEAQIRAEPKPRSASALRQERYRRNKASHVTVSDGCDGKASQVTVGDAPALSPSPNENNSNPHPHTHPDNNTRAREASPAKCQIAKPEDVSEQVWSDFLTHRKAKKAPVTQTVLDTIRREAVKAGWAMDAALAEVSARGWQGFKAEWVAEKSGASSEKAAGSDPMVAAILAKRRAAA